MNIDILTLFPEMVDPVMQSSMLGRAAARGLLNINTINIRDFTENKHKKTDDTPFGGGAGMVMMVQPVFDALKSVDAHKKRIIYMSPRGRRLDKELVTELSKETDLVFLCGHYEGIDERIIDYWKPDEISIGDYILTGGELAAMVVVDSVARLVPGVLGNEESTLGESVYSGLLEHPHYTKPREYEGLGVPEILLSGDHGKIDDWRFEQALIITKKRRPELFYEYIKSCEGLSKARRRIIDRVKSDQLD